MSDTLYIRIKKNYAADVIKDLQKNGCRGAFKGTADPGMAEKGST